MSQGVFQPVGQKRLTNIAVVRLKKAGKRFEIACYKNKVLDWRQGSESDMDEVLQTIDVFLNVSKGQFAKNEDLQLAFGTIDKVGVCKEILAKGDLQVAERERRVELDAAFRDVASIILDKCVNSDTNRPFTMGLIQRSLRDIHFAVDPKRSAKQQAFEAITKLETRFPIKRALMRVEVHVPSSARAELAHHLSGAEERFEEEELIGELLRATCLIEPGRFRSLCNLVNETGAGKVEVVAVAAQDAAAHPREVAGAACSGEMGELAGGLAGVGASGCGGEGLGQEIPGRNGAVGQLQGGYSQVVAPVAAPALRRRAEPTGEVVYSRGCIADIPEQWENRREMFKELDRLQPGWTVELRSKGSGGNAVDASFFDPSATPVGTFAAARRQALQASKS